MDGDTFDYLGESMEDVIARVEAHLRQCEMGKDSKILEKIPDAINCISPTDLRTNPDHIPFNEDLRIPTPTDVLTNNDSTDTIIYNHNQSTSTNESSTSTNEPLPTVVIQNPVMNESVIVLNEPVAVVPNPTDDDVIVVDTGNFIDLCSPAVSTIRRRRRRLAREVSDDPIVILDDIHQGQDEPILILDTQDIPLPNTSAAASAPVSGRITSIVSSAPTPQSRRSPPKRTLSGPTAQDTSNDISPSKRSRANPINEMNLSQDENAGQSINCPICLDSLFKKKLASTICGHIYCHECIKEAIKITKKCPMCKKTLKATQIHPIYLN